MESGNDNLNTEYGKRYSKKYPPAVSLASQIECYLHKLKVKTRVITFDSFKSYILDSYSSLLIVANTWLQDNGINETRVLTEQAYNCRGTPVPQWFALADVQAMDKHKLFQQGASDYISVPII